MSDRGWYGYSDLIRKARLSVSDFPNLFRYRSAIIDEAQDFSQEALKFVRALVPINQNDLFFVGDPQQRMHTNHAVMSRCGINIREKHTKRLRINYRSTEQIRQYATNILHDVEFDDFDGRINLKDDIALFNGTDPIVHNFSDKNFEYEFIINEITSLLFEGYESHEIGVFARTTNEINKYDNRLEQANISVNPLRSNSPLIKDGVHCGTMEQAKSMELRVVFLVSVTIDNMPYQYLLNKQETEEEREKVWKQEIFLLCWLYACK